MRVCVCVRACVCVSHLKTFCNYQFETEEMAILYPALWCSCLDPSYDCLVADTNLHDKTHSDLCRLRFKSSGFSEMLALGRNLTLPGIPVYNSGKSSVW